MSREQLTGRAPVPAAIVARAVPQVTSTLTRITRNVLTSLGAGPGGRLQPSQANWSAFYSTTSGPAPAGVRGA